MINIELMVLVWFGPLDYVATAIKAPTLYEYAHKRQILLFTGVNHRQLSEMLFEIILSRRMSRNEA